jgi:hypothetical protein
VSFAVLTGPVRFTLTGSVATGGFDPAAEVVLFRHDAFGQLLAFVVRVVEAPRRGEPGGTVDGAGVLQPGQYTLQVGSSSNPGGSSANAQHTAQLTFSAP